MAGKSRGLYKLCIFQERLKKKVTIKPLSKIPRLIGGCDASFENNFVIGAISVFSFPDLELLEEKYARTEVNFPYIPGFLCFREGEVFLKVYSKLDIKPDVLLFDGQGIAHLRGLGIASYVGVLLNVPTVGCAKSRLFGIHTEPGPFKGDFSFLYHPQNRLPLGVVLRTKNCTRALFVSPGNLIAIKEAKDIVLRCCPRFRIPEPLRRAHHLAQSFKRM